MGKQTSVGLDITNNSDGFDAAGGNTKRKLTLSGGDCAVAASGSNAYTFPSAADTLVGRASTDTLTNKTYSAPIITASDWASATHTHVSAATGGTLTVSATPFILVTCVGTSDFTTTSTSLVDVTGLSLSLLANKTYLVTIVGTCTASTTTGIKFQVTCANGTNDVIVVEYGTLAASALTTDGVAMNSTGAAILTTAGGTVRFFRCHFRVLMGSAGTCKLQMLKATSGTATMGANTSMTAIQCN